MNVPIGHSDDKDIVELVDAVNLGEELVDHGVIHARTLSPARTSSFADRIDLVKDDDVQACNSINWLSLTVQLKCSQTCLS